MKKLIGKDILYTVHCQQLDGVVQDGTVRALSPSERYVQIDHSWFAVDQVTVLEELTQPEPVQLQVKQQQQPAEAPAEAPKQ
jgi:hypothetical protein